MKNDYFDKKEFYVDRLWFHHQGCVYRGNGVLSWNQDKGFHLVARILEGPKPSKVEIRSIEVVKPLRMMLEINTTWGSSYVMTSPLKLRDSDLHFNHSITINFSRALFLQYMSHETTMMKEKWFGSAMYEASDKLIFPDAIHKETKLGDKPFGESFSRTGFDYDGIAEEHLSGEITDEKYIYFSWSLPKKSWSKSKSWHFAEALQDALSIIAGQAARLRYHEAHRGSKLAKEFNSSGKPTSLGLIFRLFDFDILPKEVVGPLAYFLSIKSQREHIIRKMFWQIVDASNQNSDAGQALLLSTVLEASLRTLYSLPFVPGRLSREDPFKPAKILKQFQVEYLSGEHDAKWKKRIEDVLKAYERLRHRYAHPDWVTTEGGMLSDAEIEQSINDLILLSRFYGYMILALSGFQNLEPKFPVPFSNWKPIMTMETLSKTS